MLVYTSFRKLYYQACQEHYRQLSASGTRKWTKLWTVSSLFKEGYTDVITKTCIYCSKAHGRNSTLPIWSFPLQCQLLSVIYSAFHRGILNKELKSTNNEIFHLGLMGSNPSDNKQPRSSSHVISCWIIRCRQLDAHEFQFSNVYCLNWYCGKKEKNDFSVYPEILTTPIARNPNKKTYLSIRQLGAENYLARKLPLEAMTKSPHICISDRRRSANQEPWWTGSGGEFAAVILARTLTVRICPLQS